MCELFVSKKFDIFMLGTAICVNVTLRFQTNTVGYVAFVLQRLACILELISGMQFLILSYLCALLEVLIELKW